MGQNPRNKGASKRRKRIQKAQKALQKFQCEANRLIEEGFAQVLSEEDRVRLFFLSGKGAFTDGRNIIVDPGSDALYKDVEALERTEDYLQLDRSISKDPYLALRMITRAQTIHETLHILYSCFPVQSAADPRGSTPLRLNVLSLIDNIIEDAFIENAGCSLYDNLEHFLLWRRIGGCFATQPDQGTVERVLALPEEEDAADPTVRKIKIVMKYLEYMVVFLLYPMIRQEEPEEAIADYVEKTKELFLQGSICGDPAYRYTYTQQVFDHIQELLPEEGHLDGGFLKRWIQGAKTHDPRPSSPLSHQSPGRKAAVNRRLSTDLEGKLSVSADGVRLALEKEIQVFRQEQQAAQQKIQSGSQVQYSGEDFDCASIHKAMQIEVIKPAPALQMKRAWQNLYQQHRLHIVTWSNRFSQLLKVESEVREEKYRFGNAINSKALGDVKKRFWYRTYRQKEAVQLGVLLLIDGSGSMEGERREAAIVASMILHEVLKKNGISHCIAEHRAIYALPTLEHRILVDFDGKEEEKYNLLTLEAREGTREGLTLYWAERHLAQKSDAEHKLLLMISDGVPQHDSGRGVAYFPPISTKDTANAVRSILRRGTAVVAIALDNSPGESCFEDLKEMYPDTVSCTDMTRLSSQLLKMIARKLR